MMRRHVLHYFVGLLASAPVWAAGRTGAMGSRQNAPILLICSGAGDADLHAQLCDVLLAELTKRYPETDFVKSANGLTVGLTFTLSLRTASETALIGQLGWTGTTNGQSPEVTTGVRDATIGPRQRKMFVNALLKLSALPL